MTFAEFGLSPKCSKAVEELGYASPTPICQGHSGGVGGSDVLAAAQTGTGKTAAFTLPLPAPARARQQQRLARHAPGAR